VNYTFDEAVRLVAEDSSYAYTLIRVTPAGREMFADCARRMKIPFGQDACNADELIKKTIRVWQPYYEAVITPEEAVTMILSVGRLYQAISSGSPS
jgi:hypothetical protein